MTIRYRQHLILDCSIQIPKPLDEEIWSSAAPSQLSVARPDAHLDRGRGEPIELRADEELARQMSESRRWE